MCGSLASQVFGHKQLATSEAEKGSRCGMAESTEVVFKSFGIKKNVIYVHSRSLSASTSRGGAEIHCDVLLFSPICLLDGGKMYFISWTYREEMGGRKDSRTTIKKQSIK